MEAEDGEGDQTELCNESVGVQNKTEGTLSLAVSRVDANPSFPSSILCSPGATCPGPVSLKPMVQSHLDDLRSVL